MRLINLHTGEFIAAEIRQLAKEDYNKIIASHQFEFDWQQESNKSVYKINLTSNDLILGLISMINIPKEFRIHIQLIESAKDNRGKLKRFSGIPGCLIAFAASQSFAEGYDGFVSLIPKTGLIDYYMTTYGFRSYGLYLAIEGETSKALIAKYL